MAKINEAEHKEVFLFIQFSLIPTLPTMHKLTFPNFQVTSG